MGITSFDNDELNRKKLLCNYFTERTFFVLHYVLVFECSNFATPSMIEKRSIGFWGNCDVEKN